MIFNCQQPTSSGGGSGSSGDPKPTLPFVSISKIAAGWGHSAVLFKNGMVKCWGYNNEGQLGYGDTNNRGDNVGEMGDSLPTVNLGTGRTAVQISAGDYHTVVLLDNGTVKCWGRNNYGQLGYGDTEYRGDEPGEMGDNLPPIDLGIGGTGRIIAQISASFSHTGVLFDNGAVKHWRVNGFGQLGYGDASNRGDEVGEMGDNLPIVDL